MTISSVSPAAAPVVYTPTASKGQSSPAAQATKPTAPPVVADTDGDADGSGRINVKA